MTNTPQRSPESPGVGEIAPDFHLVSNRGDPVRLSDYRGKKSVVVYFYPKDMTPGCTVEACGFRDAYETFVEAGAEVIGISSDDFESHRKFASQYHLPFLLLSDPGGKVREKYRVKPTVWVLPGRVTFVVDPQGIIRHRFSSQIQANRHVAEALAMVRDLERDLARGLEPQGLERALERGLEKA